MKKIIALIAVLASAQASAFWGDNGSYYNDGYSNGYGYGDGRGYGRGDGSARGDMEGDFTMTISGKARGNADTQWDGDTYYSGNGYSNFDGRGYGYSYDRPYYGYGYPVAPAAPVAQAPEAAK